MYKEIKEEKRIIAITVSIFIITIALYIYQFTKLTVGKSLFIEIIIQAVLGILTIILIFKETRRCNISYKYCIISDKLIINKIISKSEENIESLKIKDIIFIGNKSNIPKEYLKGKYGKHYTRNLSLKNKCYCIYKKNGKIYKFVFDPSNILINRLKNVS